MDGVTHEQTPATAEEEFLKRNTDCVYFLASPLTCKKGSECEYRHSEIARVNPRDCYYWLNGNCLNPKCAFRHPPLDGLLGAEIPTPVAPPMPQLHTPAVPPVNTPHVATKQGVPCHFFQKGYCLKGDRCPFFHPQTSGSSSKVVQSAAAATVIEPPIAKKTFGGLQKCNNQEQKVLQTNIPKSVELPPQSKPATKVQAAPTRNGVVFDKNDELPRYRQRSVTPTDDISRSRYNHAYEAHITDNSISLSGKDADDYSREPSPGFDVLVDDELRDADYYHSEEQFGRARGGHEGRSMNPINDYDMGPTSDYNMLADAEKDMYRGPRDYDSYEKHQSGHYGWEEKRRSSERMVGGTNHGQRRRYSRDESPDELVDLRQRIAKDRDYRRGPRRESDMGPPLHEVSLSNRLRGRIKMPGRSISPVERDRDMGRHRGRLSPGRLHTSSSQGRLRDRIKGRVQDNFPDEERNIRGRIRRDVTNGSNNIEFSGPRRLYEIKSRRIHEGHESRVNGLQSLGKRKYPKVETLQQSEEELSFEGPKPLSEILKRKKGADSQESRSGGYNNGVDKDSNKEESKYASVEMERQVLANKFKATDEEGTEEGLIDEDVMEDHELETFDHKEADFDYDEGENGEFEEYVDEEDDFAKQMGIELS